MKKYISLLLAIIIPVLCLSGCSKKTGGTYNKDAKINVMESGVIASNERFTLSFDSDKFSVAITSNADGKTWSTQTDGGEGVLEVRTQDTRVRKDYERFGNDADRISADPIKNGIKLTYYFDEIEISIPVCYTLREDSLKVSITGADIGQSRARYNLISVQPAPMLCRVSNEAEDSYILLSNSIGGIVDNKATTDKARSHNFGNPNQAAMDIENGFSSSDSCGCRFHGVKDGNSALFCIAEDTASAVSNGVLAGSVTDSDYSYAYSTFIFADADKFYGVSVLDGTIKQISETYEGTVSAGYYPLSGEDADYNGMAKCYRNYLIKSGYFTENKTVSGSSPYSVTYLGGVMEDTSELGIKTSKLKVLTGFDDAKAMTEKLVSATGQTPIVRLLGYGSTGINIGEIAGGYELPSKFGNDKSRKALEEYIISKNSQIYTDFTMVYYRESGSGFSYSGDCAKTAVYHVAEASPQNVPLMDFNEGLTYHMLSRDNLLKAIDKLIDFADKKSLYGVSFSDFGNVYYSDYSNGTEYGVSAKTDSDTKASIEKIKKAGHKVAVSSGNYYTVGNSDVAFDAPIEPSGRLMFTYEIPFYQLVFHGITPMYSHAVNTGADVNYYIMLAASTGTGLGFSLVKNQDAFYGNTDGEKIYGMSFDGNYELIKNSVKKYASVYKAVESSRIARYDYISSNVTKTTFENGVCIYANHSSSPQDSPAGKIEGYGYVMTGEGEGNR